MEKKEIEQINKEIEEYFKNDNPWVTLITALKTTKKEDHHKLIIDFLKNNLSMNDIKLDTLCSEVSTICDVTKGSIKKTFELLKKSERKEEGGAFPFKIDNYQDNIVQFYDTQPFFYDKNCIFWFWNDDSHRYEQVDETDLMNMLDKNLGFLGQTVSVSIRSNYLEAFKRVGRLRKPAEAPKKWLQFKGKAFSIESKEIYSVTPKYFFTNPIPYDLGESTETPVMDRIFKEWVGEDYIDSLYEIIAYCCYTDYPIHLIFCLVGSGCNGKTKFQGLIAKFIGKENICSSELDLLVDNRFETFKLYKKLLCILGETNFGVLKRTSMLKKLSGQDLIGYEKKGKTGFDDVNYAKIIINSNSLPCSEDTSQGFYRRWFIVDFPNEFKEGKDILKDIPEEEYNNLALKVTEILPKLIKDGTFIKQGSIEDRKRKYIEVSNPLSIFIESKCLKNPGCYMFYSDLYAEYCRYLTNNKRRVVSYKEFNANLILEGLDKKRTTLDGENGNYVMGIEMKGIEEEEVI